MSKTKKKTGKLIFNPAHPYQNRKDEKSSIPVTFSKNTRNPGGNLSQKDSTRLQELSLMNNT